MTKNQPKQDLMVKTSITVNAPRDEVWAALVNAEAIKHYMFGAEVISDWRVGSPIVWKGDWQGKPYEDKGVILGIEPGRTLQYSHFSPLTGEPDKPENYHTVTIELSHHGQQTRVMLSQDSNPTEEVREHSEKNWKAMLEGLKQYTEASREVSR